ncbi:MAG TPA: hypothetical protein VL614_29870 [Acetobacteraceae bacterium]|jgi:hypothetical protein|nr:hypothetical protein [Acetobacteraceae bacterium]
MREWHEFYTLAGTAGATLVGLMFVAASVGSTNWSRRAALRVFLSATVVHFSTVLCVSLFVLAPLPGVLVFGCLVAAIGCIGMIYCGIVVLDSVRDGLAKHIDWDDRIWYAGLPIVGYLTLSGAGVAEALQVEHAELVLTGAIVLLLIAGIRNAWDITVWAVTRQRNGQ